MERKTKAARFAAAWLAACALCLPLLLGSCGSDYEKASTTQTPTALISADTLKAWIDAGKVNGTGYDRVVILDVASSSSAYLTSHITGAIYVDRNEFTIQRPEGLAPAASMVSDGAKMDAIIQRSGIDKNTTIVFTTGSTYFFAARAYFAFRYWGFPKERLKVLDGYNSDFNTQYSSYMTATVPVVTPSTFSVADNPALRPDLRASLGEAIQAVGRADTQFVDMRGSTAYLGNSATNVSFILPGGTTSTAYPTVFRGHIKGALVATTNDLITGTKYKSAADLETFLTGLGLTSGKTTYAYCTFGVQASSLFFVLDAILGWPVELYDGSWSQWGLYATTAASGGKLTPGSAWDTTVLSTVDVAEPYGPPVYDDGPTYADFTTAANYDAALGVIYFGSTSAAGANQIEIEDEEYMSTGGSGGSSGGGISPGC